VTANQLIVLLDIHRGFERERHTGSVNNDLDHLAKLGYICRENASGHGWTTSPYGNRLVSSLCEIAGLGIVRTQDAEPRAFGPLRLPTQREMFERSFQRPRDFKRLSPGAQWEIDKKLGILDWEGGNLTEEDKRLMDAYYLPAKPLKKTGAKRRNSKTATRKQEKAP
jgi:hypothetical protein